MSAPFMSTARTTNSEETFLGGVGACWVSFVSKIRTPHQFAREFHRLHDLRIGGTAAEIARQIMRDLLIARIRDALQQLLSHQNETWGTKAALERARFD